MSNEVIYLYRRKGQPAWATCEAERYFELSSKQHLFEVKAARNDSDYAALEAECDELQRRLDAADEWATMASEQLKERDALRTQLEAIRAAGGEQVEVVGFLYEDGDILGKCDMDAGTFSIMASPDFDGNVSKLMTVAQHQRIVAAMAAELEKFKQANRELSESNVRRRDSELKMRAELEAARKQSPIGHVALGSHTGVVFYSHMPQLPDGTKLYALPPLAGKVSVPRELLERHLNSNGIDGVFDAGENYNTHRELRTLLATPSMEVKHDA